MINENLSTVLAVMQKESIRLAVATMETPLNFSNTQQYYNGSAGDGDDNNTVIMATTMRSVTTSTVMVRTVARSTESFLQNVVIIPLYAVIFTCCVIGNLLVILTLAQNKRMRTVTNVYLLNLVSRKNVL